MERGGIAALRVLERCMTSPLMRESMRSIGVRFIREDRDGGATEEMIERTIVKPSKDEPQYVQSPLTTRREALSLYRAVLRSSLLFVWKDNNGRVWRDVIRDSARQEFDAARFEQDGETINRLLVGGRDCLDQTLAKFLNKREQIIKEEDDALAQGRPPPQGRPRS